jgi:hypothetical protein
MYPDGASGQARRARSFACHWGTGRVKSLDWLGDDGTLEVPPVLHAATASTASIGKNNLNWLFTGAPFIL